MLLSQAGFLIFFSMTWKTDCLPWGLCANLIETKRVMCERIYVWNREKQDFVSLTNNTLRRPTRHDVNNFENKTVKVAVSNLMPYVQYSGPSEPLYGYLGSIWNIVQEKFKFRSIIKDVGYRQGLEEIVTGKADVLLLSVVFNSELVNVYYSHPYLHNWYHLYLKSPQPKPSSTLYLNIFNRKLWIYSLIVFVSLTATIYLTSYILKGIDPRYSILSCFMGVTSGFINQGIHLNLRSFSGRMQLIIALIFGGLLYYAMNAVLVSRMAVAETPYPFSSLPDIANRKGLSLCIRRSSFAYNNFTGEDRQILPEWKGVLNNGKCVNISNPTNISKIICQDNIVILENKVIMNAMSKTNILPCSIDAFPKKYFHSRNFFLTSTLFKEKIFIDNFITYMRSRGILKKLRQIWIDSDRLTLKSQDSLEQVTMDHTRGVFTLYLIAVLISLVILAFEILYEKYTTARDAPLYEFVN